MATKITFDENGTAHAHIEEIKKIGIDNILDVISHRVMREGDLTAHEIVFKNDGKCELKYTAQGAIKQFKMTHLTTSITPEGEVLLKVHPKD